MKRLFLILLVVLLSSCNEFDKICEFEVYDKTFVISLDDDYSRKNYIPKLVAHEKNFFGIYDWGNVYHSDLLPMNRWTFVGNFMKYREIPSDSAVFYFKKEIINEVKDRRKIVEGIKEMKCE
jgi:hypothetical protein